MEVGRWEMEVGRWKLGVGKIEGFKDINLRLKTDQQSINPKIQTATEN
ncbi:hypothetical protein J2X31_000759 [Flavobacterium arsenatis]|uniref:N-acetylmuramoyl-L-alanine amidase n=2 Tax=Flavobacterium arsenatis TaxID=1484332 RepID=A0ABU1TLM9_9FLAO|nr:hypothetical protein [Flavobacterium arsenatis]